MGIGSAPQPNIPNIPLSPVARNQRIAGIKSRLLLGNLPIKQKIEVMNRIASRSRYLESKYPNFRDYRIWHIFSGSTICDSHVGIIEDDFSGEDGEDSVKKFFEELEKEYFKI